MRPYEQADKMGSLLEASPTQARLQISANLGIKIDERLHPRVAEIQTPQESTLVRVVWFVTHLIRSNGNHSNIGWLFFACGPC